MYFHDHVFSRPFSVFFKIVSLTLISFSRCALLERIRINNWALCQNSTFASCTKSKCQDWSAGLYSHLQTSLEGRPRPPRLNFKNPAPLRDWYSLGTYMCEVSCRSVHPFFSFWGQKLVSRWTPPPPPTTTTTTKWRPIWDPLVGI